MECKNDYIPASAEDLPNEIWIEILKNIDSPNLLSMSQVGKRWNRLIFKYMAHLFRLNLDPDHGKFPLDETGLVPERIYKHLHLRLPKLNRSGDWVEIFEHLAPNLESLKLSLKSLDITALLEMLLLCPRLNDLCIKGYTELRSVSSNTRDITSLDQDYKLDVLDGKCRPCCVEDVEPEVVNCLCFVHEFPAINSLRLDITNGHKFEEAFLTCIPKVTELEMVIRSTDINTILRLAHQLKVLKAKVDLKASRDFIALRLPALEVLDLDFKLYYVSDMKPFLLGCKALKVAMFKFDGYEDMFPMIPECLPLVERLQISGNMETALLGLDKMTHLKTLSIKGCEINATPYYYNNYEPVTTLEKFECLDTRFTTPVLQSKYQFSCFMNRFEFVDSVTLMWRRPYYSMNDVSDALSDVRELCLITDKINLYIITAELREMKLLEKLKIVATKIAPEHFLRLRKVIVLPELRSLVIVVNSSPVPLADAAVKVASRNPSCRLKLNGNMVEPKKRAHLAGLERKNSCTYEEN